MKEIILVSAEVMGYTGYFSGQGVSSFSLAQELKNSYRVIMLIMGFKGEMPEEDFGDAIEVIRIFTPLSKRYCNFQEFLSKNPRGVQKLCFEFRDGVLEYLLTRKDRFRETIIHIQHGWGEGLIAERLKKEGFKKIIVTFQWLRTQRYLRGLFFSDFIDLSYDYPSVTFLEKWVLENIVQKIWKDESQFIRFISLCYKLRLNGLLPQKIRFYYESEIRATYFVDYISVLGKGMNDYLCWITPHDVSSKIKVIPNGVSKMYFGQTDNIREKLQQEFNFKNEDIILLFVGRIDPMKGIEYLLEALEYIEREVDDNRIGFKLLIVGETYGVYKGYRAYLESLANNLKRVEVVFTGPIYGEEKIALYTLASIFILPSVYEPFGMVALEAMAAGKPVIVSNYCGVSEIVKENFGRVVDFTNSSQRAENLGKAIIDVLREDLKEMGENAQREARKYTWDKIVTQYQRLYQFLEK